MEAFSIGLGVAGLCLVGLCGSAGAAQSQPLLRVTTHEKVVALTFDDGPDDQMIQIMDVLASNDCRATFFVIGKKLEDRAETVRRAFEAGHEIGNHSLSHTCSRNFQTANDPGPVGLEHTSLAAMEAELAEAEQRLQELFPRDGRSFAYPCYQTDVGEGPTRQSYVPVVAKLFVAARAGGEYGFFNHPYNVDLHYLGGIATERMPGTELVGLVERCARRGQWAVFAFHSIDGGRLGINEFDFAELLDHLAENKDRLWTAPVAEVAAHCRRLRAARDGENA